MKRLWVVSGDRCNRSEGSKKLWYQFWRYQRGSSGPYCAGLGIIFLLFDGYWKGHSNKWRWRESWQFKLVDRANSITSSHNSPQRQRQLQLNTPCNAIHLQSEQCIALWISCKGHKDTWPTTVSALVLCARLQMSSGDAAVDADEEATSFLSSHARYSASN